MNTIMKWKGSVGDGWTTIVEEAIPLIEARGGFIMQIKEKFGGLRIYTHGGDFDAIGDIVIEAENKAAITCEECGQPGSLSNNNGWLKTLCEHHKELR